jgi:hypothetical protein
VDQLLRPPIVPSYRYTGIGEAAAAYSIGQLAKGRGYNLGLRRSSAFAWDALRSTHVIFIGAPKWNLQLRDLPIRPEFLLDSGSVITCRQPVPGQPCEFGTVEPQGMPSDYLMEGHALITRIVGLPGYGNILALTAPSTEGALAAAEFVVSADHIEELYGHAGKSSGWPSAMQVIVHSRYSALVPVSVKYVTHRELTVEAGR